MTIAVLVDCWRQSRRRLGHDCGYCLFLKGLVTMQMRLSGVSGLKLSQPGGRILSWPERLVGVAAT
jgi:hypothetical protein